MLILTKLICLFNKTPVKNGLIFIFIYLFNTTLHAQIGLPQIINFSSENYHAGAQNWKIDQDEQGIMYFANNEGLLTFNGGNWQLYQLPNKTNLRSVAIAKNGRIYVGGQDEIGFFYPDQTGQLKFKV